MDSRIDELSAIAEEINFATYIYKYNVGLASRLYRDKAYELSKRIWRLEPGLYNSYLAVRKPAPDPIHCSVPREELAKVFEYPSRNACQRMRTCLSFMLNYQWVATTPPDTNSLLNLFAVNRLHFSGGSYGRIYGGSFFDSPRNIQSLAAATSGVSTPIEPPVMFAAKTAIHAGRGETLGGPVERAALMYEGVIHDQLTRIVRSNSNVRCIPYYYATSMCHGSIMDAGSRVIAPCTNAGEGMLILFTEFLVHYRGKLTENEWQLAMIYVHSQLDYLWVNYKFLHGDFHPGNLVFRLAPGGVELPVIDTDGKTRYSFVLPFEPMLVDFGESILSNVPPHATVRCNPLSTPANDIIRFYGRVSGYAYNGDERQASWGIISWLDSMMTDYEEHAPAAILPAKIVTRVTHAKCISLYEEVVMRPGIVSVAGPRNIPPSSSLNVQSWAELLYVLRAQVSGVGLTPEQIQTVESVEQHRDKLLLDLQRRGGDKQFNIMHIQALMLGNKQLRQECMQLLGRE